jgi:hypothetical protein
MTKIRHGPLLVSVGVVVLVMIGASCCSRNTAHVLNRVWEYKVVFQGSLLENVSPNDVHGEAALSASLSTLGEQGWELQFISAPFYFFRRIRHEPPPD